MKNVYLQVIKEMQIKCECNIYFFVGLGGIKKTDTV